MGAKTGSLARRSQAEVREALSRCSDRPLKSLPLLFRGLSPNMRGYVPSSRMSLREVPSAQIVLALRCCGRRHEYGGRGIPCQTPNRLVFLPAGSYFPDLVRAGHCREGAGPTVRPNHYNLFTVLCNDVVVCSVASADAEE